MANVVISEANSSNSELFGKVGDGADLIVVTATGYVVAVLDSIALFGLDNVVQVQGTVASYDSSGISSEDGDARIDVAASGLVSGYTAINALAGGMSITNSGTISGTGNAGAAVSASGSENKIINNGTMSGFYGIYMDPEAVGGFIEITNTGIIDGTLYSIVGRTIDVNNTGVIFDTIDVSGNLTLNNSGSIFGSVFGDEFGDSVTNAGLINDVVSLGGGIDTYDGSAGGRVAFSIALEAGDDVGIGGDFRDIFFPGTGNDDIDCGGGDDRVGIGVVSGTDGNDIYEGGLGIDTLDARESSTGVTVDLETGDASGTRIGRDTISGFERVIGSAGADTITGDAGDNAFIGGAGGDVLVGGDGNDRLFGEANADTITGGAGRDILSGGGSADRFVYAAATDSGITGATRDRITDFTAGTDDIDISALAGAFTFIGGGAFTSVGNQVRFSAVGGDTLVEISTDTDTAAEMSILLHGTIALTAGDFNL